MWAWDIFLESGDILKDFLTFDEQIELLKTRGLIIENEEEVKKILKTENYYNVINGYKDLFIDKESETEKFIEGVTFEEIYSLFCIDRQIRNILFQNILKVENTLKSLIAYEFSKEYGKDNYLKFNNFDTLREDLSVPHKVKEKRAKFIHSLIAKIQSDIAASIYKKDYINHYVIQYGFVPMWVLVNAINLGRLSDFYSLMKQNERIKVSSHWNIREDELSQYIKTLAYFRNLCAHDERIYDARTGRNRNIPDTFIHE